MSQWKSAEESRAEVIAAMGVELGEPFYAIENELTWAHWRWHEYRVLFEGKPGRLDLLNDTAPFFFKTVQDVLFEDTLLAIARLTGSKRSAGRENLTIQMLPALAPGLAPRLGELVDEAVASSAFATDWRHRRLAHRDLGLALDSQVRPLEPASRKAVDLALDRLAATLNHIQQHYLDSTTGYTFSPTVQGAETLLHVLRAGQLRMADRQARWGRGEFHEDDLKQAPPI